MNWNLTIDAPHNWWKKLRSINISSNIFRNQCEILLYSIIPLVPIYVAVNFSSLIFVFGLLLHNENWRRSRKKKLLLFSIQTTYTSIHSMNLRYSIYIIWSSDTSIQVVFNANKFAIVTSNLWMKFIFVLLCSSYLIVLNESLKRIDD